MEKNKQVAAVKAKADSAASAPKMDSPEEKISKKKLAIEETEKKLTVPRRKSHQLRAS